MSLDSINKKRLVIRIVLLCLIVAFGFGLYYIGKEHEVLIDNKDVEIAGKSYTAPEYMVLVVDGNEEKSMEFYPDDRDVVKVAGPSHTFKLSVINEDTEQVIKTVERSFNFGRTGKLMISLPAILENAPDVNLPLPNLHSDEEVEEAAPAESAPEVPADGETPANSDAPVAPALSD